MSRYFGKYFPIHPSTGVDHRQIYHTDVYNSVPHYLSELASICQTTATLKVASDGGVERFVTNNSRPRPNSPANFNNVEAGREFLGTSTL